MPTNTTSRPKSDATSALGRPAPVPRGSWRDRTRRKPGIGTAYRVGVFLVGLAFIALGVALAVLPGPLTIPPVLIGLYVWSTEFSWARRFLDSFKAKGKDAWRHAKLHPVSSSIITIGGLVLAGAAIWAVSHWHLVERAKQAVGLGG